MENDEMDITSMHVIEIKVNESNEIFMIKSSVLELEEKNKLLRKDINPYFTSSNQTNPNHIFSEMKVLLYNPELSDRELASFFRSPEKYSFMDVINMKNLYCEKRNELVEIVGPKASYLKDELTLFVIKTHPHSMTTIL